MLHPAGPRHYCREGGGRAKRPSRPCCDAASHLGTTLVPARLVGMPPLTPPPRHPACSASASLAQVGKVTEGDCFGETALVYGLLQPFSVRSKSLCRVLFVRVEQWKKICASHPTDGRIVADIVHQRVKHMAADPAQPPQVVAVLDTIVVAVNELLRQQMIDQAGRLCLAASVSGAAPRQLWHGRFTFPHRPHGRVVATARPQSRRACVVFEMTTAAETTRILPLLLLQVGDVYAMQRILAGGFGATTPPLKSRV